MSIHEQGVERDGVDVGIGGECVANERLTGGSYTRDLHIVYNYVNYKWLY